MPTLLGVLCALTLFVGCEKKEAVAPSTQAEGASTGHFDSTAKVSQIVAKPQASKPSAPLPKGTTCVTAECHTKLATAKQIHGPVSEKACDACHSEETDVHKYPLKRNAVETCTYCHKVVNNTTHQHAALKNGCNTCHEPHVAKTKFLLKADSTEALCLSCHNTPLKRFAHDPFAKGQCTLCHQPHEADNKMLLRGGTGRDHCFSCHTDTKNKLQQAANVHKPARTDCDLCHSPHATEYPKQLLKPVAETCLGCHEKVKKDEALPVKHDAMTDENSCLNCHLAHASDQKSLLPARMDKMCLKCHEKPVQAKDGHTVRSMKFITQVKYLHGPIKSGDCGACHNPHGTENPSLLGGAFPSKFYTTFDAKKYGLCFTCHPQDLALTKRTDSLTNFRDGDVNLHFIHVNRDQKGRSCKTCHDMHGSDLPNHMASEVPFEGSNYLMPMNYDKKETGGSCAPGCHDQRSYDRTKVSPATQPTTQPAGPTTRGAL
jgi:predicted CXXCH cytochrome family protein